MPTPGPRELLARLIAFDTTSRNSNLALVEFVREFEFRTMPGEDGGRLFAAVREFAERELLPEMRARHPGAGFEWQELMSYPALGPLPGASFEALCRRLSGTRRPAKLAFGTEAGHFAARGVPAVVCGPGNIAVAHRADEHVEIEQLERCTAFLRQLVGAALVA